MMSDDCGQEQEVEHADDAQRLVPLDLFQLRAGPGDFLAIENDLVLDIERDQQAGRSRAATAATGQTSIRTARP